MRKSNISDGAARSLVGLFRKPGCYIARTDPEPLYWPAIKSHLQEGKYSPNAVRRVWIPKANGDVRPLGIPCVADRIIQQAIAQILAPIFEGQFSNDSYGFRPGRNAHQAVRRVRDYLRSGHRVVVDIDLAAL